MLSGYQLFYNGRANTPCYPTASTATGSSALQLTGIPCEKDGGKFLSVDWAVPCSEDGVTVTGFAMERATNSTKPRADAVKIMSVQINANGGSYGGWIVPDTYTQADFITACCAGCDPIASVTIPAPIILNGSCVLAAPTIPGCVYQGDLFVAPLTGSNTTFTATGYANDANGVAIAMSPATAAGTTVALLAADMQSKWATELGGGTFTASGNSILWTGTAAKSFGVTIVQS